MVGMTSVVALFGGEGSDGGGPERNREGDDREEGEKVEELGGGHSRELNDLVGCLGSEGWKDRVKPERLVRETEDDKGGRVAEPTGGTKQVYITVATLCNQIFTRLPMARYQGGGSTCIASLKYGVYSRTYL